MRTSTRLGRKQWKAYEKELQDKVVFLEKFKEHEDFYATEVIELKEMLEAKIKYANDLEGEVAEQYAGGFDEALKQVGFLYAYLDVSSYGYFKEIRDGKLVDKLPSGVDVAGATS